MSTLVERLAAVLSRNRAEEFGRDVWNEFVIPPYFAKLDLLTARKPRILIGGRGCGKTMLFRYFSHQSMFSRSRLNVPADTISQVGLYWRTDTQFCNAMTGRGVPEDTWQCAFEHYLALTLTLDFLAALKSVASSNLKFITLEEVDRMDFGALSAFDSTLPSREQELRAALLCRLRSFETWVSNVRKVPEPLFLPGTALLVAAMDVARTAHSHLKPLACFVYVDEYENLCGYQRRVINTHLKHSSSPLVFHVAMKRHAFHDRATTGPESVSDIHDVRQHDLEQYLLEEGFPTFAAEILLLSLQESELPTPIDPSVLRNPEFLASRRATDYSHAIREYASAVFPGLSTEELANEVFTDPVLFAQLLTRVRKALDLRGSRYIAARFIRPTLKPASIIVPALLSRPRLQPQEVIDELDKLEAEKPNRFTGAHQWIHNNFIGSYLQLYAPYSRICPFYAGFSTFCHLSRGNLRHFLELCYKSLGRVSVDAAQLRVSATHQAEAARQSSAGFLGEVRSFGPHGERLHGFVLRLGTLFALAHSRPTQSEPEQNHFSVTRGRDALSEFDYEFLRESLKWSVLFEEESTKQKDPTRPNVVDYVLNPIYAPYFYLSYRKKRKLEISTGQLKCLISGSVDEYAEMIRLLARRWEIEDESLAPQTALPLFAPE